MKTTLRLLIFKTLKKSEPLMGRLRVNLATLLSVKLIVDDSKN